MPDTPSPQTARPKWRDRWGRDTDTRQGRFWAWVHFLFIDHAVLRTFWTNTEQVAPGVWRSNQPGPGRLRALARKGFRTVLRLRAETEASHATLPRQTCAAEGLRLEVVGLTPARPPSRDQIAALIDVFETAPRPLLMHCKSGADRTGIAAAIYLLAIEGRSAAEARDQLHWRFLHFRDRRTGALDLMIDRYEAAHRATGIAFRDWIATAYDPDAILSDWQAKKP